MATNSLTSRHITYEGTAFVNGTASGTLIASNVELSFWGGINQQTGEVIDRHHPLNGVCLQDAILAIPGGRGSCGGSLIIMELLLNGKCPKALLFERREEILTAGVMLAEEIFAKSIPVVAIDPEDFKQLLGSHGRQIYVDGKRISDAKLEDSPQVELEERRSESREYVTAVKLSPSDQVILDGGCGEAARIAMRVILRMADLMEAQELISVEQVHIDACFNTGPASLVLPKKLREMGGKFRVPTTMNSISVDQQRWRAQGIDVNFGEASSEIADTYIDMGAQPTFTCAPYQLESAPQQGDQICWGESNAVIYANSVIGARTLKTPDGIETMIALIGRAPKAGVHLDENRKASLWVKVPPIQSEDVDDSFWPLLGSSIGSLVGSRIPVITGLETMSPSKDDLRAFAAAFATSCGAPMFHMVGLTPEASSFDAVSLPPNELLSIELDWELPRSCWKELNSICAGQKVDLVSLGNPHFSFREIRKLADLCRGRTKHNDVKIIVTCGRSAHGLAVQAGLVEQLEQFGVNFIRDTCWCMITEPIIPRTSHVILTNSGKYAHYGPGLTGKAFGFCSLAICTEAACSGSYSGEMPAWLQAAA